MNILKNYKRITNYISNNKRDILSPYFWSQNSRIIKSRIKVLNHVSKELFLSNLQTIEYRPWNVNIELTNICNANCVFCAYQYQTRQKRVMSDEVYKKILDDYCEIGGGELLMQVVVGDPAIDPKFIERIRDARARPEITNISTITNGISFNKKKIDEFLLSGISSIRISTGPWREDLYEAIFRNNSYKRVIDNITYMLRKNMEYGNPVDITITFRTNISISETVALADYQKIAHLPHKIDFNVDYDTWIGEIKQEDLVDGMRIRPIAELEKEPCFELYDGATIFVDGSVGLCSCRDYNADSELIIGNIKSASLIDIWRSEKVLAIRKKFYKGIYPDICLKCSNYVNLDMYRKKAGIERVKITRKRYNMKSNVVK
jgi:MoaA/NifB/PqqE/SkfB family radical SAM enzyme